MFTEYDGSAFSTAINYESVDYFTQGDNYPHRYIYYLRNDTGDLINLGQYAMINTIPSVYPDTGQNKLGESMTIDFTLVYNLASVSEYPDLLDYSGNNEYISFSLDCLDVQAGDVKLQRLANGSFEQLDTASFTASGYYYICWKPPFIDFDGYITASDNYWTVTEVPKISYLSSFSTSLNAEYIKYTISGTITRTDKLQLFTGTPDCTSGNEVGDESNFSSIYSSYSSYYFDVWYPDTTLEMHI